MARPAVRGAGHADPAARPRRGTDGRAPASAGSSAAWTPRRSSASSCRSRRIPRPPQDPDHERRAGRSPRCQSLNTKFAALATTARRPRQGRRLGPDHGHQQLRQGQSSGTSRASPARCSFTVNQDRQAHTLPSAPPRRTHRRRGHPCVDGTSSSTCSTARPTRSTPAPARSQERRRRRSTRGHRSLQATTVKLNDGQVPPPARVGQATGARRNFRSRQTRRATRLLGWAGRPWSPLARTPRSSRHRHASTSATNTFTDSCRASTSPSSQDAGATPPSSSPWPATPRRRRPTSSAGRAPTTLLSDDRQPHRP